jgi:hypothetical protein
VGLPYRKSGRAQTHIRDGAAMRRVEQSTLLIKAQEVNVRARAL